MKQDLPRFMMLATRFIDPLFHSFYYMQYVRSHHAVSACPMTPFFPRLNIYYMILDKISQFSEGKYTIDVPATQISADFEEKRGDSAAVIEALSVTQRFISTCKQLLRLHSFGLWTQHNNKYPLPRHASSQTRQSAQISVHWNKHHRPLNVNGIDDERPLKEGASSPSSLLQLEQGLRE